jgi:hypothetical protein
MPSSNDPDQPEPADDKDGSSNRRRNPATYGERLTGRTAAAAARAMTAAHRFRSARNGPIRPEARPDPPDDAEPPPTGDGDDAD